MTEKEVDVLYALIRDHTDLYGTSAIFYTQINTLVQMIPLWVRGMAEFAAEHEHEHRLAVELAMKGMK